MCVECIVDVTCRMFMLQQSFRNQENVRIGVKGVVMGAPPAATKRSVLGEIGNDFTACGVAAARKVGGEDVKLHGVPRK